MQCLLFLNHGVSSVISTPFELIQLSIR